MIRLLSITSVSLLLAGSALPAETASSFNDQARFIAGLSVTGTPLESLAAASGAWREHAADFDKAWAELKKRQLDPIDAWADSQLGNNPGATDPLYYMFSGPDFLYAHAFFPKASVYVMCGTEPVGKIPDVTTLSEGSLSNSLRGIRNSLDAVLSFSFFITKSMKTDLTQTQLSGTLPILYVFLARHGCQINDVRLVGLDANGAFVTEKPKTNGVKIEFTGHSGQQQSLYYFTTDLSNWGIKSNPGFMKFCEGLRPGNAFVKAASYLMHLDEFTTVRDFLLNHTRHIVEDDSGIPLRAFPQERWAVFPFGNYPGPIDLFKEKYQTDLKRLFEASDHEPLPFSFGYRWRPNESSLLYAVNLATVPKARPVAEAAAKVGE